MKPAVLRPQALRDQQGEVRYYRKEGGTRLAVKLANATNAALDQIELDPGIGSPTLGKVLGIPGLRTWRVAKFPLLWCYFERGDHLDVVRLLGERQDIAAILGDEFASNSDGTRVAAGAGTELDDWSMTACWPSWPAGTDPLPSFETQDYRSQRSLSGSAPGRAEAPA